MTDIGEVDQWISQLSQCKQLSESDVKKLCDKVSLFHAICASVALLFILAAANADPVWMLVVPSLSRHEKSSWRRIMSSPYDAQLPFAAIFMVNLYVLTALPVYRHTRSLNHNRTF